METSPRASLKDGVFLRTAFEVAELGTCDRARVGAVIVKDGRCITWGYNGAPPGLPHCDENGHGWKPTSYTEMVMLADELGLNIGDKVSPAAVARWGCRNATHAEANALAFAARSGISTDGGTLYVTMSPCETCSRLLIAAGIKRVVAHEEYRDPRGVMVLQAANIPIVIGGQARG